MRWCRLHNNMTYVRDCVNIRGILDERDHDGVVENCVWDIQPKCKEWEWGFCSAGTSPENQIVVDCSLMTGHSVLRFEYDGLCIVIKVGNKPLHGRRVLPDHADCPLKKSRYLTVKFFSFFSFSKRLMTNSCAIVVIFPWDDRTLASLRLKASITSFAILLASVLFARSVYSSKAK